MARRSAELAIVRGAIPEPQSITGPNEAAIRALEDEITSGRDVCRPIFLQHIADRIYSLT